MKEKLITRDYCFILAANFLLFFGFWLLMPVLPFYLSEQFGAGKAMVGVVLSCYTLASLCIRPFSGYLLDTFARKPLYLLAYFVFTAMFGGYMLASTLALFIVLRIVHGVSFGMVTVGGNTIVIDIMPSSRRGEGLGYYGLSNNVAMALGPMAGLFMHDAGMPYMAVFGCSMGSCVAGMCCAAMVRTPYKPPVARPPLSLDRFILVRGLPAGLSLLLLSIPYGMTTNYVAMYARQLGLTASNGMFFTFMALGIAVSRLFSGRQVDKGHVTGVIMSGICAAVACPAMLSAMAWTAAAHPEACTALFFGTALLIGLAYGTMFPAYNTLFVNLAPNSQRGTANSTYLTSWDVGIGIGMLGGGYIAQALSFSAAYMAGAAVAAASAAYFHFVVTPHYKRNKMR